jgi:hypothetical protein
MANTLHELLTLGQDVSVTDLILPANRSCAIDLQSRLCNLGILDPIISGDTDKPFGPVSPADGRVGVNTRNAVFVFYQIAGLPFIENFLTREMISALLAAQPDTFLPVKFDNEPADDIQTRLAKRVVRYMRKNNYWIAKAPNMCNIVYVEGLDADGKVNKDRANEWNDRRMVIRIAPDGQPAMLANDLATTEPGRIYTLSPLNPKGAARIAFGQYKAWVDGMHKGYQPALVQRGNVRVHRDINRDGLRNANDPIDVGDGFGINQHSTAPDYTPAFVDKFSAGCLVGCRMRWHLSFMQIVRQDIRYQMNKGYLFVTTVISGDDLARVEPE